MEKTVWVIQGLIAIILSIFVYNFIMQLAIYVRWRKNKLVTKGTKVTFSFDGVVLVSGVIEEVTLKRIILRNERDRIIAVSLKEFMKCTWELHPQNDTEALGGA